MAYIGGTPSSYVKVRSGKPKVDKKGYPRTEGVPVPVSVDGSYPGGPGGTVLLGYWNVGSSGNAGEFSFTYPNMTINDLTQGGVDASAELLALDTGDTVYFATPTGSNTLVLGGAASDGGGFVNLIANTEAPNGFVDDGQLAAVWVTAP